MQTRLDERSSNLTSPRLQPVPLTGNGPYRLEVRRLVNAVRHDPHSLKLLIWEATRALKELDRQQREHSRRNNEPQLIGCGNVALSRREEDVMTWVAQGKSNSAIAAILGISTHTVDTHLRRVFGKFGTTSRTVAAVMSVTYGLVPMVAIPT